MGGAARSAGHPAAKAAGPQLEGAVSAIRCGVRCGTYHRVFVKRVERRMKPYEVSPTPVSESSVQLCLRVCPRCPHS